jgi:hypothetical protein
VVGQADSLNARTHADPARLWKQLGAPYPLRALPPSSDPILGEWSLKFAEVPQGSFVVGVNAGTLMALVFAGRPPPRLADTLAACVAAQLAVFDIPEDRIASEVSALRSATFGKNRDRSLISILNEVAFQFELAAAECAITSPEELLEIQTGLNTIPHRAASPSCMFASDAVIGLLGSQTFH